MNHKTDITNITIDDIDNLQKIEDDHLEFKSGIIKFEELKQKISVAISAFANTEGGLFIVGVDKNGKIDGFLRYNGKQAIKDWIEQIINIEPLCNYEIKEIDGIDSKGIISIDKCIIIIKVYQSKIAPHMAYDKKYYIRSGSHSYPASHYIVEAIRLRSKFQRPKVLWRLIEHDRKSNVIRLALFTVENQNAYNVKVSFKEYPTSLKTCENIFPLEIPIINIKYPFLMDIDVWGFGSQLWGKDSLELILEYEDVIGEKYKDNYIIDKKKSLPVINIGSENLEEIKKALEDIAKYIKK
jgi:hypothetical protein